VLDASIAGTNSAIGHDFSHSPAAAGYRRAGALAPWRTVRDDWGSGIATVPFLAYLFKILTARRGRSECSMLF
jgi:hypothetical protein